MIASEILEQDVLEYNYQNEKNLFLADGNVFDEKISPHAKLVSLFLDYKELEINHSNGVELDEYVISKTFSIPVDEVKKILKDELDYKHILSECEDD